ncbi:MAG TPA: ABC transporter ATP-binding protein [Kiloniellales bacterium]
MQDELKTIQKRVGTTFVHVTHDQEEAMAIADEIVVMNQGRIEDIGAPQRVYLRPGSLFAAGFMGEANLIPGRIAAAAAGTITLSTAFGSLALPTSTLGALAPTEGRKIKLCIRPEHLKPNRDNSELIGLGPARVVDDAFFGTHYRCHLTSEAQPEAPFVAYLPQTASLTVGDTVALCFDPAAAVILADTDK